MALQTNIERNNIPIQDNFLEYTKMYGNLNKGRSYIGSLMGSIKAPSKSRLGSFKQQGSQFFNLYNKGIDPKRNYLVDDNNIVYGTYDKVPSRPALSSLNEWSVNQANIIDSTNLERERRKLNISTLAHANPDRFMTQRVFGLSDVV